MNAYGLSREMQANRLRLKQLETSRLAEPEPMAARSSESGISRFV